MSLSLQVTPRPTSPHLLGALPTRVQAALWRATDLHRSPHPTVPTGHALLDAELPGGGWPTQGLTEILCPPGAALEWRLLGPAWRQLVHRQRPLVLIAPPHSPHWPGLQQAGLTADQLIWVQAHSTAERLWATEQVLKSNDFGAVVSWLPQARPEALRRLQLCAQGAQGPVFVWRPTTAQWSPSAAPLRALVSAGIDWNLRVHLFKRQGPAHEHPLEWACVPQALATVLPPRHPHAHAMSRTLFSFTPSEASHVMDRPAAHHLTPARHLSITH